MNKEADLQAQIHKLNIEKCDLAVKLHSLSSGVIMVLKNKALRVCDEKKLDRLSERQRDGSRQRYRTLN